MRVISSLLLSNYHEHSPLNHFYKGLHGSDYDTASFPTKNPEVVHGQDFINQILKIPLPYNMTPPRSVHQVCQSTIALVASEKQKSDCTCGRRRDIRRKYAVACHVYLGPRTRTHCGIPVACRLAYAPLRLASIFFSISCICCILCIYTRLYAHRDRIENKTTNYILTWASR